jgi:hypothetical protein
MVPWMQSRLFKPASQRALQTWVRTHLETQAQCDFHCSFSSNKGKCNLQQNNEITLTPNVPHTPIYRLLLRACTQCYDTTLASLFISERRLRHPERSWSATISVTSEWEAGI